MLTRMPNLHPIIKSVAATIKSHSELKLNYQRLTVTERDLQVESSKYKYVYPSDFSSQNYETKLKSDLNDMDLMQPFVVLDAENTVYLYLPT